MGFEKGVQTYKISQGYLGFLKFFTVKQNSIKNEGSFNGHE